jgi:2-polyprenyl-6-hydroxyphenyl methylase/3-demethylubiquinone-9 3-methyltransferase
MMQNADPIEIEKFSAMADAWWDKKGELRALHDINPVRLDYIDSRAGISGKRILDIGCGGGILSEAMARSGAEVTGIDMAEVSLESAKMHLRLSGCKVDYIQITAEDLAAKRKNYFDVTVCMELLEHVPDPQSIFNACGMLVKPGGHIFFGTINRTWAAYLLVVVVAERIFGIVPKGLHSYKKFIKPSEIESWAQKSGLKLIDLTGLRYVPFIRHCSLTRDTRMNYMMHFQKTV